LEGNVKILVSVKRVVDYNIKVRAKADGSDVDIANAKMSMNPFDEIAIEEALRLKEQGKATEVVAVTIGASKAEEVLRTAMAMGADRSVHIVTETEIQPLAAAALLKKIVEKEEPQLVMLGKQAIDDDANQTGQMLAALLNWGQGTFASKVVLEGNEAFVTRETDNGLVTIAIKLPAIITTDLRLNEARYVKLPDIMKARTKPIEKFTSDALGVDVTPQLTTLKVEDPVKRKGGVKVTSVEELVQKLKEEAKII
jgi:electron transfer flavoprotein beta subunit